MYSIIVGLSNLKGCRRCNSSFLETSLACHSSCSNLQRMFTYPMGDSCHVQTLKKHTSSPPEPAAAPLVLP